MMREIKSPLLGYAVEVLHGVIFPCQAELKQRLGNFGVS